MARNIELVLGLRGCRIVFEMVQNLIKIWLKELDEKNLGLGRCNIANNPTLENNIKR